MEFYINTYLADKLIAEKEQNKDLIIVIIYNPNTKNIEKYISELKVAYLEWYSKIEFKEIPNKNTVDLDKIYLTPEIKPFVMPCTPFEATPMEPLEWLKKAAKYEPLNVFGEKAVIIYNEAEDTK